MNAEIFETAFVEEWESYWLNHPQLFLWHATTIIRKTTAPDCLKHQIIQAPVSDAPMRFLVYDLDPAFDVVEVVSTLCEKLKFPMAKVGYAASPYRAAFFQLTLHHVAEECRETVRELLTRASPSSRVSEFLPPIRLSEDVLEMSGGVVHRMLRLRQWEELCHGIFATFGPCDVTAGARAVLAADGGRHASSDGSGAKVPWHRPHRTGTDNARFDWNGSIPVIRVRFLNDPVDAWYALRSLQHWLAKSWKVLLTFAPHEGSEYDAWKELLEVSRRPIGAIGLCRCPNDGHCDRINDPVHQQQFLHTCTLPSPCRFRDDSRHGPFFLH